MEAVKEKTMEGKAFDIVGDFKVHLSKYLHENFQYFKRHPKNGMQCILDDYEKGNVFLFTEHYTEQDCWDDFMRSVLTFCFEKMYNETCVDRNMFSKMYDCHSNSIAWNRWADEKIDSNVDKYRYLGIIIKHILDNKQHTMSPIFEQFEIKLK